MTVLKLLLNFQLFTGLIFVIVNGLMYNIYDLSVVRLLWSIFIYWAEWALDPVWKYMCIPIFNLGLIVYKTVYSGQLQYLNSVLISKTYHYSTRSSDYHCLVIPKSRTVLGERAVSDAGLTFWNSLPLSLPVSVLSLLGHLCHSVLNLKLTSLKLLIHHRLPLCLKDLSSGYWLDYSLILVCHRLMLRALGTGTIEITDYNFINASSHKLFDH